MIRNETNANMKLSIQMCTNVRNYLSFYTLKLNLSFEIKFLLYNILILNIIS